MSGRLNHWRGQQGMSLVESLVALLVLSIGLLGIAGLLIEGLRSNRSALYRTQAVYLVSDIADRIRANGNARDAYDTDSYGTAPATRDCAASVNSPGSNCSSSELAEDDLARWIESVRTSLPTIEGNPPRSEIRYFAPAASGEPERYQIEIAWQEPGERQPFDFRHELVLMPRGDT